MTTEYLEELERQIDDAKALPEGEPFAGPYFSRSQITDDFTLRVGQPGAKEVTFEATQCRPLREG